MKHSTLQTFIAGAVYCGFALISLQAQVVPATPAASTPPTANDNASVSVGHDDSDHFSLRAGGFLLSSIRTKLSLETSLGQGGTEVDLSKDLGAKNSLNLFRADGEWRFASKHKVQFTYFNIDRSASKAIDRTINWGDQTYTINTTLSSHFQTTVYKVNYGYTFYRNSANTQEVSALIGLHVTRTEASLGIANVGSTKGVGVTAPLPMFGFEWKARLADQLTSYVSYQYFGISLDDNKYSGNLSDFQATLEYAFTRHWSVGGGYNRFTTRATMKTNNLQLDLRHSYNGVMVFVGTSF